MIKTKNKKRMQFFPRKAVFNKSLSPIRIDELHSLMKKNTRFIREKVTGAYSPCVQIQYEYDGKKAEGMGFVGYEDEQYTYIFTAQHVVSGAYDGFKLVPKFEDLKKGSLLSVFTMLRAKSLLEVDGIATHPSIDLSLIRCKRNKNISFDLFPIVHKSWNRYDICWSYRNSSNDARDAIFTVYHESKISRSIKSDKNHHLREYFVAQNKNIPTLKGNDDFTDLSGLSGSCILDKDFQIRGLAIISNLSSQLLYAVSAKTMLDFYEKEKK